MSTSPPTTLKYTRARIYFTYSFAIQMEDSYTVDVADIKGRCQRFSEERKDRYRNPLQPTRCRIGTPDSRSGLTPHIKFRDEDNDSATGPAADSATIEFNKVPATVDDLEISLSATMRLFTSAFTLTFCVESDPAKPADTDQVNRLLGLIRYSERGDDPCEIHFETKCISLYRLYRELVEDVLLEDTQDAPGCHWLGYKESRLVYEADHGQSPWTTTHLELDSDSAGVILPETDWAAEDFVSEKIRQLYRYADTLAPMIFRTPGGFDLEPAYVAKSSSIARSGLANMGVAARTYVNISSRACLVMSADMDEQPTNHIVADLLNLLELVRSRWHMLLMMNRVLDVRIRELRRTFQGDEIRDEIEVLTAFLQIREWMLTSLEDQAAYVIAGEFLSKLNRELNDSFCIEALRDQAQDKLVLLNNAYRDLQEREWLRNGS